MSISLLSFNFHHNMLQYIKIKIFCIVHPAKTFGIVSNPGRHKYDICLHNITTNISKHKMQTDKFHGVIHLGTFWQTYFNMVRNTIHLFLCRRMKDIHSVLYSFSEETKTNRNKGWKFSHRFSVGNTLS